MGAESVLRRARMSERPELLDELEYPLDVTEQRLVVEELGRQMSLALDARSLVGEALDLFARLGTDPAATSGWRRKVFGISPEEWVALEPRYR